LTSIPVGDEAVVRIEAETDVGEEKIERRLVFLLDDADRLAGRLVRDDLTEDELILVGSEAELWKMEAQAEEERVARPRPEWL
jgi:hypothetical protein